MKKELRKKKILFIINPISGVARKEGIPEKIARYLDYVQFDFTIRYTQYAGHAVEIAREAVSEGYDVVCAVGGDGSINEIAQSLVHTDVALAIIPFGSGNGLATHLTIPSRDVAGALDVLNNAKEVWIDSVKTNKGYFFSCAGFGLDSSVARRFKRHAIRGFFSYVWAVVSELFFYFKPFHAKVIIDGLEIEREFYLFTVFNSNQYGYNFGPFPFTSLKDGLLDVMVVTRFPLWKLVYIFLCIAFKRADLIKEAEVYRARKIEIKGDPKRVYQFDGDHFIFHDDLVMEIEPQSLKVLVPQNLNSF
ncbi:MAG: diacylglycerol kinase family lipid kinase [Chitinophagales bacterium]|nr:diacylglycerol kinase family lipid kinase [Chitinophagales bacterium]MDW8272923.1 diacylglycerol kinase family lipid kinase [Chitinophagales bacterium]